MSLTIKDCFVTAQNVSNRSPFQFSIILLELQSRIEAKGPLLFVFLAQRDFHELEKYFSKTSRFSNPSYKCTMSITKNEMSK